MEELIQTSVNGRIGMILLRDPAKRNALSQPMAAQLKEALERFRFDDAIGAVVIRGAGGYFCAGGDITSMKKRVDAYARGEKGETETRTNMRNLNQIVICIREMEKPVIAWIEGACAGGGMSLALACDFSYAEENTKMNFAFAGIGLAPDMGSTLMLTKRVGPTRATDLFMTGRLFSALDAESWGIITKAVPADELEELVMKQAQKLANGPTCSYKAIKEAVNRISYPDLQLCMSIETDVQDRLTYTADHYEAVTAFLEKRKPVFTGK